MNLPSCVISKARQWLTSFVFKQLALIPVVMGLNIAHGNMEGKCEVYKGTKTTKLTLKFTCHGD